MPIIFSTRLTGFCIGAGLGPLQVIELRRLPRRSWDRSTGEMQHNQLRWKILLCLMQSSAAKCAARTRVHASSQTVTIDATRPSITSILEALKTGLSKPKFYF